MLAGLLQTGCVTDVLFRWRADEVAIRGIRTPTTDVITVVVDLKNVRGLADGTYTFECPKGGAIEGPTPMMWLGKTPVRDPVWLEFERGSDIESDSLGWVHIESGNGSIPELKVLSEDLRGLETDPPDLAHTYDPTFFKLGDSRVALRKIRTLDRTFLVQCFTAPDRGSRYVHRGCVRIGEGQQWAVRRPILWVTGPIAFIVDVTLIPAYLLRNRIVHGAILGPGTAGP